MKIPILDLTGRTSSRRRGLTAVAAAVIGAFGLGLIAGVAHASDTDKICPPAGSESQLPPAPANPAVDLVHAFWDAAKSHIGNQAFSFVMNRLRVPQRGATTHPRRAPSARFTPEYRT